MAEFRFDLEALYQAIDVERERQGLSWAGLSDQTGVSASTIRRFSHADDAEADGVLALIRWLTAIPEDFVEGVTVSGTALPRPDRDHIRVDMELVARAVGQPRGAAGRTRTTIQHLATVAGSSGQPIASLTRQSEL